MEKITDLSQICSIDKSNEGVWKDFIMCGKKTNIKVLVYGDDSDIVQNYVKEQMRDKLKKINISGKNGVQFDEEDVEEMLENTVTPALIRFGGICQTDDTALSFKGAEFPKLKTADCVKEYEALLKGSPELQSFILEQAKNRTDFLS